METVNGLTTKGCLLH